MSLGTEFLDRLRQDVRYGIRMLISRSGFTAVAVLSLVLGIGATTASFSVADAVLIDPLHRDWRPTHPVHMERHRCICADGSTVKHARTRHRFLPDQAGREPESDQRQVPTDLRAVS